MLFDQHVTFSNKIQMWRLQNLNSNFVCQVAKQLNPEIWRLNFIVRLVTLLMENAREKKMIEHFEKHVGFRTDRFANFVDIG